jgi:hypothetical protein
MRFAYYGGQSVKSGVMRSYRHELRELLHTCLYAITSPCHVRKATLQVHRPYFVTLNQNQCNRMCRRTNKFPGRAVTLLSGNVAGHGTGYRNFFQSGALNVDWKIYGAGNSSTAVTWP